MTNSLSSVLLWDEQRLSVCSFRGLSDEDARGKIAEHYLIFRLDLMVSLTKFLEAQLHSADQHRSLSSVGNETKHPGSRSRCQCQLLFVGSDRLNCLTRRIRSSGLRVIPVALDVHMHTCATAGEQRLPTLALGHEANFWGPFLFDWCCRGWSRGRPSQLYRGDLSWLSCTP